MMKRIFLIINLTLFSLSLFAQSTINGKTDKLSYYIGDSISYTFSLPKQSSLVLTNNFTSSDTLMLLNSKVDTLASHINYTYTYISLLQGKVHLPDFVISNQNDNKTLYNVFSPEIEILLPQIDTTNIEVKPLKSIFSVGYTLKEILCIIGLIIVGILLCGLIVYYIRYKRSHPTIFTPKPKPLLPEDQEAIESIEQLEYSALINQGKIKEHYTRLTEILWKYLLRRYQINAFEQTSFQIKQDLASKDIDATCQDRINKVFSIADLVKFAKFIPDNNTNIQVLQESKNFVIQTKRTIEKSDSDLENTSINKTDNYA